MNATPTRRSLLFAGAGALLLVVRPAAATPEALRAAIERFAGGAVPRDGRVTLTIAELVENGNAVPVEVVVDAPVAQVRRIALVTERNPSPEVAVFTLGPLAGRARVATRMRLATSGGVVALAQLADGSVWQQRVDVLVTLAACVEG